MQKQCTHFMCLDAGIAARLQTDLQGAWPRGCEAVLYIALLMVCWQRSAALVLHLHRQISDQAAIA